MKKINKKTLLKIAISLLLLIVIYFKIDERVLIDNFSLGIKYLDIPYLRVVFLLLILNYNVGSIRWKNLLKTFLKISVSLGLLNHIFIKVDVKALLDNLSHLNTAYLPAIFLLIVLNYVVSSIRWKKLLSIYEGVEHVSLMYLIKLYFIGSFFNNFLPTSIGGDVYKAMKLGKYLNDHSKAFASTFMERFSGVLILGLLASFGLVSAFKWKGAFLFVLFLVGVFVFFKALNIASKKIKKLKKFSDAIFLYKERKDVIYYALFTSVFVQVFSILTQYFIFVALGYNIPLAFSFFAFPVIILASFIIPSQNSFGVQDSLYVAFFATVGVPLAGAVSASVVYHITRLLVSLLGGLFYATEK